jgi:hypothetical protein
MRSNALFLCKPLAVSAAGQGSGFGVSLPILVAELL